jgi:hypothetical protein
MGFDELFPDESFGGYIVKKFVLFALAALWLVAMGCGDSTTETEVIAAPEVEVAELATESEAETRHDVVYVCACGPECSCNEVSTEPGTCSCGTNLEWAHVVKVEDPEALLCACSEGCSCEIDADDETKCSCGNDIRRVSMEGTGLYYCKCGGTCTCNFVSAEPATCHCGMELTAAS